MNYEQRLKAAAKIILADDARTGDERVSTEELGVTASLKPHQVEGVSWLIRRYNLGVNVVLGKELSYHFRCVWLSGKFKRKSRINELTWMHWLNLQETR